MLRADIQSDPGGELASRYGVSSVPTFIVFDRHGEEIRRLGGRPTAPIPDLRRALMEGAR